jgi:hypothetical protein
MKKLNFFKVVGLFLLILAAVLVVGCKKDPIYDSQYTITATSVGPGGTVSPSSLEVAKGKNASVSLIPDSGYSVDVLKVDDEIEPVPTNLIYTFSEVVAKHNLVVTWKKNVVAILHNIVVLPTTGGTVTSNLSQVGDGLGAVLTFNADPGFKPDSVIINDKSFPLTGNTYALSNITSDINVKGVFGKTNLWYLIKGPWKEVKWEERVVNTTYWYNQVVPRVDIYVFTDQVVKGQYQFQEYFANNQLVGNGPYILKQDSLIIGPDSNGNFGLRNKIISLTDDTLVIKLYGRYFDPNEGGYVPSKDKEDLYTYIHP